MVKQYRKIKEHSYRLMLGEGEDCTVIVVALLCHVDYEKAHSLMKVEGREHKGRSSVASVISVIEELGFKVEEFKPDRQPSGCKYTPKTISLLLNKGAYLCTSAKHVFSVIDGVVEDWTHGTKTRITKIYSVEEL